MARSEMAERLEGKVDALKARGQVTGAEVAALGKQLKMVPEGERADIGKKIDALPRVKASGGGKSKPERADVGEKIEDEEVEG